MFGDLVDTHAWSKSSSEHSEPSNVICNYIFMYYMLIFVNNIHEKMYFSQNCIFKSFSHASHVI